MFATADPRLASVCYHPVGEYGTEEEDPGGLWQFLVSRELVDHAENYLSRFFGHLCTVDSGSQTGVGFFFMMLVATHRSVQEALLEQLEEHDTRRREFFPHFVKLLELITGEVLQTAFLHDTVDILLVYAVSACRFSWASTCRVSLVRAQQYLMTRENQDQERRLSRSKKERQVEKRRKQAARQKEQKQELQLLKTGQRVR